MHYGNINAYVAVLIRRLLRSPYCRNNSMHPPYSIPWSLSSIFIYVIYRICAERGCTAGISSAWSFVEQHTYGSLMMYITFPAFYRIYYL